MSYKSVMQKIVLGTLLSHAAIGVPPEQIRSGKEFIVPTVTSFPRNLSMPQQSYSITDKDGNRYNMDRTANRIYVYKDIQNGPVTQWDDYGFKSWKATGENSQTKDPVKLPSKGVNTGYIESFRERPLELTSKDTSVNLHVRDSYYTGPNNELGKYVSLAANMKHDLMKYYGLKDSQEFAAFLNSKGLDMEDIGWLAVGFIPEGALYAVNRGKDGKVIFYAAEESFDNLSKAARYLGSSIDELKAYGIDEEICHIARKSFDKSIRTLAGIIREEMDTKEMQMDFYVQQAKGAQGNHKLAMHYMKLAAMKENDIKTTREVYTKMLGQYQRDLESKSEEHEEPHEGGQKSHQASSIDERVASIMENGSSQSKIENAESKNNVVYGVFGKSNYSGEQADKSKSEYSEQNTSKKSYSAKATGSKSSKSEAKESADSESAKESAKSHSEATAEDGQHTAESSDAQSEAA